MGEFYQVLNYNILCHAHWCMLLGSCLPLYSSLRVDGDLGDENQRSEERTWYFLVKFFIQRISALDHIALFPQEVIEWLDY